MALIFSTSIAQLMAASGIASILSPNYSTPTAITVYSGTQDTAADIITNWVNYNSSQPNLLAHFNGNIWVTQPAGSALVQTSNYATATPINSGTATWAILWCNLDVTTGELAGSTIPTTSFFVAPVSNTTSNGIIRFESVVLTAGTPISILDASILTTFI